jgi:CDP-6-deoxy-D-xylo-4-hexulose-3-dehydrase
LISLASDTISQDELDHASHFLRTASRLTKGEETANFEKEFADTVGASYAVFVNSGSSANLLVAAALKESGRLRNNVVVCPAISWVTTVTPFTHLGYDVLLCDADKSSLGVDVRHLEEIFRKSRPSLLVLVHVLGHANDMDKIQELCREYDVLIVEDTCEALGSVSFDGKKLGTYGVGGTFSFYYGHHISTIEGGMVVTDDRDFWQLMLSMRSHGWSRDLEPGSRRELMETYGIDEFRNLYTFFWPGFNFRSTDLQAFIGRMQLSHLDEIVAIRARNFAHYKEKLGRYWFQDSRTSVLSSFAYGIAVENRSEVASALSAAGIESRPLVCGNIGRHPFWIRRHQTPELPLADFIHDFGMYLPNHANLTLEEIDFVTTEFQAVATPAFPPG